MTDKYKIDVGTEISCPGCERVMMRCIEKPEPGMNGYDRCFENVEWNGKAGDKTLCQHCGGAFMTLSPLDSGCYVKGLGYTW